MKTLNKPSLLIAAYSATGKTYMGEKYENVIDLRTTPYYEIGKDVATHKDDNASKVHSVSNVNPDWPDNYITALKKALNEYDYVFTITHTEKVLNHLDNAGVEFLLVMPKEEDMDIIRERCTARGNKPEFVNAIRGTASFLERTKGKNYKISFLKRGEFLEDWFKRNGLKLIPKEKSNESK